MEGSVFLLVGLEIVATGVCSSSAAFSSYKETFLNWHAEHVYPILNKVSIFYYYTLLEHQLESQFLNLYWNEMDHVWITVWVSEQWKQKFS